MARSKTVKKIVFVIVEGPSDSEALGAIMSHIYDKNAVYVHILHCDITTERDVRPNNIVAKVGGLVRDYAKNNPFRQSDFKQIIHIVDMDGAFIPDANIVEDMTEEKTLYQTNQIRTCNIAGIQKRNREKRVNLNRLVSTSEIWKIPYRIYYMSCNLDHALYGKLNSNDEEKMRDSVLFAKKYKNNIPAFLQFISQPEISVGGDHRESWRYIKEGLHSLERHTNLALCFKDDGGELLNPTSPSSTLAPRA